MGDGGAATSAALDAPRDVEVDSDGNLYIADAGHHRIRKVAGGVISTYAGTGTTGFSGDGGPAADARLDAPKCMIISAESVMFVCDTDNNRVRKITPTGTISTTAGIGADASGGDGADASGGDGGLATSASLSSPRGLVDDNGNLYIAESNSQDLWMSSSGDLLLTS